MSKQPKKTYIDIPFPMTDLKMLVRQKYFTLVYPLDHKLSQSLDVRMSVRLLGVDDEEYFLWTSGQSEFPRPQIGAYYDIGYTRDCTLGSVHQGEWDNTYDAGSLEEYLSHEPRDENGAMSPDSYVRVLCLQQHSFSLKDLNKKYGRYQRNT